MTDSPFRAAPDDFDHPDHEQLVSYADNQLDEIDREWIARHIEMCEVCREDVDDLLRVKASLVTKAPAQERTTPAAAIAAAAAGIALAIWVGSRLMSPNPPAPVPAPVAQAAASSPTPVPPTPLPSPTAAAEVSPLPTPVSVPPAVVLSKDEQGRVNRALATGRMELPPNMAVLRGHDGTLTGPETSAPAFRPTSPIATAIIDARPQFSWTARPGATRYAITVFDERFREVAKGDNLKTTTWRPGRDLPRGRVLQWQVSTISGDETAISPAPPQPEARFMILDTATIARLAKERKRLATEPIALGLVLAKAGLFADADTVLQSALNDDRYDRSQVRALLARLRAR